MELLYSYNYFLKECVTDSKAFFMEIAKLDGVDIAYEDFGAGYPILLIHGFASNANINWIGPGWINTLNDAGYRVIALDNRGHGQSSKFYEEDDYALETMANDARLLLEYLGIEKAHVMGYSMGGRITSMLTYKHSELVEKAILAGNGYNMVSGGFPSTDIRDGLLASSIDDVTSEAGKGFRFFAEQTKSDLKALAACIMGVRSHIEKDLFSQLKPEVLVTIGTEDTVATDGDKLAALIPNGKFAPIPKRNHMNAVGDKVYKQHVIEFLKNV